nr:ATP synthase protein 8 [Gramma loreto]
MPQLNPTPWMVIMVFAWIIFLAIIPSKLKSHLFPKDPTHKNSKKSKASSWGWPWY